MPTNSGSTASSRSYRAALCAFLVVGIAGAATAAAARPPELESRATAPDAIAATGPWTVLAQPRGETLAATLELPRDAQAPRGRVLQLPPGTQAVTIVEVEAAGWTGAPLAGRVHLGPVMIARGVPVAPIWLDEDAAAALGKAGIGQVTILLATRDEGGLTPLSAAESSANRGGYLIVTADAYAGELQPLIEWKTACGYEVTVARISEIGGTLDAVRDFVREAYETWENPPLYVLLVGDVEDVPSGDLLGNVSDHVYACVEGDDFLADLYVGRFVAKTPADVAVQVAKTLGYESTPDTSGTDPGDPRTWFDRALMVAGNHGSSTPIPTCQWIAAELRRRCEMEVDSVYYPPVSDGCSQLWGCPVSDAVNTGVSIVNYRGWARENPPGWDAPDYTTEDVTRLNNGWKLPFVFSIVCNTGDFGRPDEDCFGEVWVKAGTAAEPRGAVGFIGTAEHWSLTRWNDRIDLGLFEAIIHDGVQQVGPALVDAKAQLLAHFPTEIRLDDVTGEEAVEFYHYIYNILGDPSLELWTTRPRDVRIPDLPRSVAYGGNFIELHIAAKDDGSPLAGAHIALVQQGVLIGYAVSDAAGRAGVSLSIGTREPIVCTVTGANLNPHRATIPVTDEDRALTCIAAEVSGADGFTPGVARDVHVTVRNTGTADLGGATAAIDAPDGVTVLQGAATFGAILAGQTSTTQVPLRFRAAAETENGARLRFLLTPSVGGSALRATEFWLSAAAPELVCTALTDGAGGVFDPAEEFDLIVTLRNDGATAGGALTALLDAPPPGIDLALVDPQAAFAEIPPGGSADNAADPFRLRLGAQVVPGTVIPLRMTVTAAQGPVMAVSCNLIVGAPAARTPTGPDAYGYYAYDSADIDYPEQAPVYRWIEISPRYGGPGTSLGIVVDNYVPQIVALPFDFVYYGESYSSIRVSDNGWLAFDTEYFYDMRNWAMPDRWGSACQVAAFWDNLNPMVTGTDGIYAWHDTDGGRFVIAWSRIQNYTEQASHWQSFEIVLHDPAHHPTPSGDGEIVFQYKHVANDDWEYMYSTVGIEDQTETVGIQYSYANAYASGASPLAPGLAIRFTTEAPSYHPAGPDAPQAPFLRVAAGNPSSSGVATLLFRIGAGQTGEVAVFDAAGRRVRTLVAGQAVGSHGGAPSPGGVISWDGRDTAGRAVPSGPYWFRLVSGGAARTSRIVIAR